MTTIHEIKQANAAAGQFFFSAATMRFFDSRVLGEVYEGPGGIYFVTSERFHPSSGKAPPRRYTVRRFLSSGQVDTVSFQEYRTAAQAKAAARTHARLG